MKLEEVKEILALMESHNLAEVEIEEEGRKIRLRKAVAAEERVPVNIGTPVPVVAAVPHAAGAPSAADADSAGGKGKKAGDLIEVESPMVGTFYRASGPDSEPFASVGDVVKVDTVVCIIEAMKVMNEIRAEVEGEVVEFLVENGEALEYGQPIMLLRPAGAPK